MSAFNLPTGDFVTSTLNGALTAASTSATIGAGLNLAATNGILNLDYDSLLAVGVDGGPETIFYTSYNSGTGAVTGITRSLVQTTAVAHANGATVQAGTSVAYFLSTDVANIIQATPTTTWTPAYSGCSVAPITAANYQTFGKWCFVDLTISVAGTSSATSKTITLPVAAKRVSYYLCAQAEDNGSVLTSPASLVTRAGSTTVDLFKDMTGANWTSTAGWFVKFSFVYETN